MNTGWMVSTVARRAKSAGTAARMRDIASPRSRPRGARRPVGSAIRAHGELIRRRRGRSTACAMTSAAMRADAVPSDLPDDSSSWDDARPTLVAGRAHKATHERCKSMTSSQKILAMCERRNQAFARKDIVAMMADYTDDCTVESPSYGRVTGREAVERAGTGFGRSPTCGWSTPIS
jgi:hypothetical protein